MDSVEGSTSDTVEADLKCTEMVSFESNEPELNLTEETTFKEIRKYEPVNNFHLLEKGTPIALSISRVEGINGFLPGSVAVFRYPQSAMYTNWKDNLVYWTKIGLLPKKIKDYRTSITGLKAEDLIYYSTPWDEVKEVLQIILKDRTVIGMGLESDLECLGIEGIVKAENKYDFRDKFVDNTNQPIELRDIVYAFTNGGKKVLEYQPGYVGPKTNIPVFKCCYMMIIYNWSKEDEKKSSKDRQLGPRHSGDYPNYQWVKDFIEYAVTLEIIPKID